MKAVFFDLDGTLLPMDQEAFVKDYVKRLTAWVHKRGFDEKGFAIAMNKGVFATMKNDGSVTNERRFWDSFTEVCGIMTKDDMEYIELFYEEEFDKVSCSCGFNKKSREVIDFVKNRGVAAVLATNPVFPQKATFCRMGWAGLEPHDFALVTTYENSSFCKPDPRYYFEILNKLGLDGKDCIMVGNDALEDAAAAKCGMEVFLLTDCLINRSGTDISLYRHGGMDDLMEFLKERL